MSSNDHIPTGKVARASKFLKTGVRVAGAYAAGGVRNMFKKEKDTEATDIAAATALFKGMTELRGSALKVAQMLSMDQNNLGEGFRKVLQQAQYKVEPMSGPLAVKAFTSDIGKHPEQVFDKFDTKAIRAASLGQVHQAWKDGQRLAVKIQYPGVADSVRSDIKMLAKLGKGIGVRLANVTPEKMDEFIGEIEARLVEELDYSIELSNSLKFKELCAPLDDIVFPDYYPELSGKRTLTMSWLEGQHLNEFLAQNPSAELRHKVGATLWDYFQHQFHAIQNINTDPHPGNFLILPDGRLGALDFGSTKAFPQELYHAFFGLLEPGIFDSNVDKARAHLLKLEILRPKDTEQRVAELYPVFARLITLLARPYHQGRFYFNDPTFQGEIRAMEPELRNIREARMNKDMIFLFRAFYGLFSLLQMLDVTLDTPDRYQPAAS